MKYLLLCTLFCCNSLLLTQAASLGEAYNYKVQKSVQLGSDTNNVVTNQPVSIDSTSSQARILNNVQHIQHSAEAQSFYLPPDFKNVANPLQQQQQNFNLPQAQPQPEVIHLQAPIDADQTKISLRLPTAAPLTVNHPNYPAPYPYQIPRRHYKIILVRSPPKPTPPPQPVEPEIEEKTLIYVLVKKPEEPTEAQLQEIQQAQQNSFKLNKPEVYFIKYKPVKDDAAAATNAATSQVVTQDNQFDVQKQQGAINEIIQRQAQQNGASNQGYSYNEGTKKI